jgi:hypothetical protein
MKRKSEKANHGRVADSDPRLAQPGAGGMLPKSAVPHEGAALEGFITEITPLKRTDDDTRRAQRTLRTWLR